MAATTTAAKEVTISLKVMVHKEKNKVIFAEADSNFVDTLFSIMTLPMATIVRLTKKYSDEDSKALGSLKTLYQSLVELPISYLSAEESKFMMLNPRTSSYDHCRKLKLNIDDTEPMQYFVCQYRNCSYFSTCNFVRCVCGRLMDQELIYNVGASGDDGGVFVPNLTTFIVTDDLCVKPNTPDVSIQLIRDLGFSDATQLEERSIDIGRKQMLSLVVAAIFFKYPLTYLVFHNVQPIDGSVNPKVGTLIQHLSSDEKDTNVKTMMLKLTLQKSTSKFLFAEAEEDFVDFLFGFLEIPLGTLIGKLMNGNTSSPMCMNNLFASISDLNVERWIKSQQLKDMLIQPMLEWKYVSVNQIFPLNVSKNFTKRPYVLKDPRVKERFLKVHGTKFMLTDDLVVTPLSSISVIAMLNKLKVPLIDVETHAVSIGIEQGLKILMASLKSNTALTDALLGEIIEKKKSCVIQLGSRRLM